MKRIESLITLSILMSAGFIVLASILPLIF
ncbi:UNVERIFIED_ORG: hypothetical protein FHW05_004578 [Pantoea agglomerans]